MAVLKQKLNRKNESGSYDEIHLKTDATVISLSPTDETLLSDEISSLKSSVSNGKSLIASAITDKGVSTASDATFQTMSNNIRNIETVHDQFDFTYTGEYAIEYDSGGWKIKFLTSGIFVSNMQMNCDLFLVGGGGSGVAVSGQSGGGGGGYTATYHNIQIHPGVIYKVIIGDGAPCAGNLSNGYSGSPTIFDTYIVNGGNGATQTTGGSGGSAGGINHGTAGEDGGGTGGQGSTTREFGEPSGKLYAGGGSGTNGVAGHGGGGFSSYNAYSDGENGLPNTGGGGGAGYQSSSRSYKAGGGGSGIAIIRNHRTSPPESQEPIYRIIKGKYNFNTTLTLPTSWCNERFTFTGYYSDLYGNSYRGMIVSKENASSNLLLRYISIDGLYLNLYNFDTNSMTMSNSSYRKVSILEQKVTKNFYDWFIANTTLISANPY